MQSVHAPGAPAAVGPYAHAVRSGNFLFCSGQTALDPATGQLVEDDTEIQTRRVLANVEAVLEAAGLGLGDVVKTTVYLISMDDFEAMNRVYAEAFGDHRPARTTVEVSRLPKGTRVEIECIAEMRGA